MLTPLERAGKVREALGGGERLVPGTMSEGEHQARLLLPPGSRILTAEEAAAIRAYIPTHGTTAHLYALLAGKGQT